MKTIVYLYKQSWQLFWLATVLALVGGLSGAGVIASVGKGIHGDADYGKLGVSFFALAFLQLVCSSLSATALLRSTQRAIFRMRVDMSQKLLHTPFKKLQEMGKPALLTIMTDDINTFVMAFTLVPKALSDITIILACLGYMAWLSWQLFLMFTLSVIALLVTYTLLERIPGRNMVALRTHVGTLYGNFRGLIEGSKELQLNSMRGNHFVDRVIAPTAGNLKDSFVVGMTQYTWVANAGVMMMYSIIGLLVFVIPAWFPQQAESVAAVTLITLFIMNPIGDLMSLLPALRRANIALGKIQELDGTLPALGAGEAPANPFGSYDKVLLELKGVCHSYPSAKNDSQFMLGPIDLTIRKGEIVFIVGGNGCGKTTLSMLLLGLYEPEAGHMAMNGTPVTQRNVAHYRQYFSAVFADFHLFEELLVHDTAELKQRTTRYLHDLGLGEKVSVEDGKFSTINLSSGQRKRLALIASYIEDRSVYLFDEWAADQDPEFKEVFYRAILPDLKRRGKTVIAITHDDKYFDSADHIVKLRDGQIVTSDAARHTDFSDDQLAYE
ncbi:MULTISPECIES: cyclic peptide export ABC transporter [unclassified Duganella]|uniref:cyclic peptide export ABC transporter n=1 Tax=unclassified Duganella TaxID=2636909 RepID=UPI00087515FB|nr:MULTISPECIES: cyclic peptide export ABC transporter [unclassified Duganella]OEZ60781.1 ABC transporter ATP-binding protein YojI [Duganella sp. HH105]OFA04001.1 ABC transporter ATP-binding protein YojI [Duganella sp. HH101]